MTERDLALRSRPALAVRLACLAFSPCVLAGCAAPAHGEASLRTSESEVSSPEDSSAQEFNDWSAAGVEYEQAAAELELPPGVVFPEWEERASDKTGGYQVGLPTSLAQDYWRDAWAVEWLEQRGVNPEREAKAFDVLKNEVPACDLMQPEHSDNNTRKNWAEFLSLAEMGDPSGFQAYITNNRFTVKREGE